MGLHGVFQIDVEFFKIGLVSQTDSDQSNSLFGFAPYGIPGVERCASSGDRWQRGARARMGCECYLLLSQAALAHSFFTCFIIDQA